MITTLVLNGGLMRIIIDGDACPSRKIIEEVAKSYNLEVIIFCTYDHLIKSNYSEVRIVDKGFQSVDMKVVNENKKNDIVVSQDYGVAAMVLGKGSHAINPSGTIYTEGNIDTLLMKRHINAKVRRGGGKIQGPKKRKASDDERLRRNLIRLIEDNKDK